MPAVNDSRDDPECDTVPVDDRAYLYGDGLFETLLCIDGCILWLDLHLARLARGARRLKIPCDTEAVRRLLLEETRGRAAGGFVIRLTLSRGGGVRGYRPDPQSRPRYRISATELGVDPLQPLPPMRLAESKIVLAEQPALAGLKHCNRLEQVLGAAEAAELDVDDVLMCKSDGSLQSTSRANLFVLRQRTLLTAPCDRCGIAGTRRGLIMQTLAPLLGLSVVEEAIPYSDLQASDACFVTNALCGVRAVHAVDGLSLTIPPLVNELQRLYRERALACIAA